MHDFEHAKVHGRVLLRALKLLEETDAAHPFVEEANQHAVLRPGPAVRGRQILHDVVGGGGERVFRRLDLIVRSAGGARVDLELLDRLRDLVHELVRPGAHERSAQASQHDEKRGGRAHERARGHRDQIDRHMRRYRRRRHRRGRLGSDVEVVRRRRRHPVVPARLPRPGGRRARRGAWRGRVRDRGPWA